MTKELSGAEILIRALQEEKVDTIFGYPGGAVLYIYDEISKQDNIRHILVRHEQGAVHAAEGYARSSKKVGVALVTSGPGITNAVTGIADAYMDSIPLVVISGQVPTPLIGTDAFQEVDAVGITRPCVKHNFLVRDVRDLAATIKKAFYIASSGRPGPVLIDIPKDVSMKTTVYEYPKSVSMRSYNPTVRGHQGQIKKSLQKLLSAHRPVLYIGGGVILANAADKLAKFAQVINYPVVNTLMGLGGYPGDDRQCLGMPGMHGTYEANFAMQHADVIFAVGTRFDDRVIGNPSHFSSVERTIIHIDVDPTSISKRVRADIPIVGDINSVLGDMLEMLPKIEYQPNKDRLSSWWKEIEAWRKKDSLIYNRKSKIIKPQMVVEKLYKVTKGDAIVASDVGQHQMFAAQYYKFNQPRRWINSGGLGTMGFGLPAAMGAQMANPNASVACVSGEGSIQMCIQELATCRQYHLPIKIVLLNNGYLGMVRQWQEIFHGNRYSESYMETLPDFVKLAEAYGHKGVRIEKPDDIEEALKIAFADKKNLWFLDFVTDREENVFPMVPGGKGLTEIIMRPEEK